MDATDNLAQGVANPSNGFASQTTKPTTVCVARRAASSWRIAASPASCDRIGRELWTNWRRSSGGEKLHGFYQLPVWRRFLVYAFSLGQHALVEDARYNY